MSRDQKEMALDETTLSQTQQSSNNGFFYQENSATTNQSVVMYLRNPDGTMNVDYLMEETDLDDFKNDFDDSWENDSRVIASTSV